MACLNGTNHISSTVDVCRVLFREWRSSSQYCEWWDSSHQWPPGNRLSKSLIMQIHRAMQASMSLQFMSSAGSGCSAYDNLTVGIRSLSTAYFKPYDVCSTYVHWSSRRRTVHFAQKIRSSIGTSLNMLFVFFVLWCYSHRWCDSLFFSVYVVCSVQCKLYVTGVTMLNILFYLTTQFSPWLDLICANSYISKVTKRILNVYFIVHHISY